jgi:hypothetical protein
LTLCFGGFIGLWLGSFALGFLVWEAFRREKNYCREKTAEGKLLKGKEWLKRG